MAPDPASSSRDEDELRNVEDQLALRCGMCEIAFRVLVAFLAFVILSMMNETNIECAIDVSTRRSHDDGDFTTWFDGLRTTRRTALFQKNAGKTISIKADVGSVGQADKDATLIAGQFGAAREEEDPDPPDACTRRDSEAWEGRLKDFCGEDTRFGESLEDFVKDGWWDGFIYLVFIAYKIRKLYNRHHGVLPVNFFVFLTDADFEDLENGISPFGEYCLCSLCSNCCPSNAAAAEAAAEGKPLKKDDWKFRVFGFYIRLLDIVFPLIAFAALITARSCTHDDGQQVTTFDRTEYGAQNFQGTGGHLGSGRTGFWLVWCWLCLLVAECIDLFGACTNRYCRRFSKAALTTLAVLVSAVMIVKDFIVFFFKDFTAAFAIMFPLGLNFSFSMSACLSIMKVFMFLATCIDVTSQSHKRLARNKSVRDFLEKKGFALQEITNLSRGRCDSLPVIVGSSVRVTETE